MLFLVALSSHLVCRPPNLLLDSNLRCKIILCLTKKSTRTSRNIFRKEKVQYSTMQMSHTHFGAKASRNRLYAVMKKWTSRTRRFLRLLCDEECFDISSAEMSYKVSDTGKGFHPSSNLLLTGIQ